MSQILQYLRLNLEDYFRLNTWLNSRSQPSFRILAYNIRYNYILAYVYSTCSWCTHFYHTLLQCLTDKHRNCRNIPYSLQIRIYVKILKYRKINLITLSIKSSLVHEPIMAAVQKRRKYSKKRKANLRKYTNIRDIEEYIEDLSRQQKTG